MRALGMLLLLSASVLGLVLLTRWDNDRRHERAIVSRAAARAKLREVIRAERAEASRAPARPAVQPVVVDELDELDELDPEYLPGSGSAALNRRAFGGGSL